MRLFPKTFAPLLWAALLPIAGAAILSRFGSHHWILDLFTHSQQQYALGLVLVAAGAFITGHRRTGLLATLALVLPLSAITYYYPPAKMPTAPEAPAIRLLLFNILRSNPNHAGTLAWLQEQDADVLVLLEVDKQWSNDLAPLEKRYPHRTARLRSDNFGVAIYSKFPMGAEQTLGSGPHTVPCLAADIEWPAATVRLFAMHPVPPVSKRTAENRNAYLRKFAPVVARTEGPVLVMGDFNCSPWSSYFKEFITESRLLDSGRKRGFQSTWNRCNPLFSIPIDHILHSPHFTTTARAIGPVLGSDHRAVSVTLALTDPPPARKMPVPESPPVPTRPSQLEPSSLQPAPSPPSPRRPRLRRVPE